jgi:hypothetical protein|tara:strand:+ start:2041 stop:2268 length:228 start_codon:yes stop_codon:yes gene_type:complete
MRDKKEMSDMTESEISYRKFLKNLGVTTHKEIEELVNKKIENGELQNNTKLNITAHIRIDELDLNHTINSTILLP